MSDSTRSAVPAPPPKADRHGSARRNTAADAQTVLAYHRRTEHHVERYAAGPETLDWDAQPNPFREFAGAPRVVLPLRTAGGASDDPLPFAELPAAQPYPFELPSLAYLLELSMGLAAWKEYGPDRWALRCNPSSGNLHPTECYVLAFGLAELDDGLYHYVSRDHALERRWQPDRNRPTPQTQATEPALYIGLSSIHWREAWKYGERAFRYCQLDTGHAVGALRYAAAILGWELAMIPNLDHDQLASLLGLDREADFAKAEHEDPELLLGVSVAGTTQSVGATADLSPDSVMDKTTEMRGDESWTGTANLLDPHPFYRWPIIDQVAQASRPPSVDSVSGIEEIRPNEWADTWPEPGQGAPSAAPLAAGPKRTAAQVIRGRRSAQHFNPQISMPAETFFGILARLLAKQASEEITNLPWDSLPFSPRLHLLIFVHRVDGLKPGLYVLPRSSEGETILRDLLHPGFAWEAVTAENKYLPLYLLLAADLRKVARGFSCHQAIASDSCFSLAMIAEFAPLIEEAPWRYRHLCWEAGLIGQVLYLEAEAAGFNGTGIGCFFDEAVREGFGIKDDRLTPLYHFTVGQALVDSRISTLPPYTHRKVTEQPADQAGAAQQ